MRSGLCTVDQYDGSNLMSKIDNFFYRIDRTKTVGGMIDGYKFRFGRKKFFERFDIQLTFVGNRDYFKVRLLIFTDKLPGNDIRMMFQSGDNYLVAFFYECLPVGSGNQVDAFGYTAGDDNFLF